MTEIQPRARKSLLKQSGLTSLVAGAAVAAGLLLDIMIATLFGAGPVTDAFFVAARIPLGVAALVMAAANQALVPAFATSLAQHGEKETWTLASILISTALVGGAALVGLVGMLSAPLMLLTAPGLPAGELRLAAQMAPMTFAMIPLVTASEVLRALLNARYSFVMPAAMSVALTGTAAILLFVLPREARSIAWAYLAGASLQLMLMFLFAVRDGFRYRPSLQLRNQQFRSVCRLTVRPLIGGALNPVTRIGEQVVLSFLPPGSITIAAYGSRLIHAIGGTVFFRSVMVALLPRMTEAQARSRRQEVNRMTGQGLRIMLALSLPLTAFTAVLATPMALAVFHRGRFSRDNALLLGAMIAVYSASLVGSGVQRALLAPFFARLDTRTPLRNTVYGVAANLVLLPVAVLLLGFHQPRAVIGVAVAYSLAQYVNVAHAWYRLRLEGARPGAGVLGFGLRLLAASAAAAAVMVLITQVLGLEAERERWRLLLLTTGVAVAGLIALGLTLAAIAPSELQPLMVRARMALSRRPIPVPTAISKRAPESKGRGI